MNKTFVNPYLNVPQDEIKRTNTEISVHDWNLLRTVRVAQGTFTTANNILIKKLCDECRNRGFVDMSKHSEFESFVAGLHLVPDEEFNRLHNCSPNRISGQGVDGENVGRGTTSESGSASQPTLGNASISQGRVSGKKRSRAAKPQETVQP